MKGGDPFCDPSQGSSTHISISCVLPMKLYVFETPAMRFTISEINDTTLKGLPLGLSWTVYVQMMKNDCSINGSNSWVVMSLNGESQLTIISLSFFSLGFSLYRVIHAN